jgi:hypothetical protein
MRKPQVAGTGGKGEEGGWFVFTEYERIMLDLHTLLLAVEFLSRGQNAFLSYFCLIRRGVAVTIGG